MDLTSNQLQTLLNLKKAPDSDNIRYKEIIKKSLINNELIIYLLNNKELEEIDADPGDYLGVNILPFYLIHPTQHNIQNYICYELNTEELNRYNVKMKKQQIIFYILCDEKSNIEKNTGIARHDLLAALIMDIFDWSNLFGERIHCVSDISSVVDTDYACRTLIFEQQTDNNLAKTRNGTPTMLRSIYAAESED